MSPLTVVGICLSQLFIGFLWYWTGFNAGMTEGKRRGGAA